MTPETQWDWLESALVEGQRIPQDERQAWLDRACSDRPELRDDLAALLVASDESPGFLGNLAQELVGPDVRGLLEERSEDSILDAAHLSHMTEITARLSTALADRYSIERELGSGGMATVYLAEDLKHHRKVAVKVLRPELVAVLGAKRFVQEIETTANLQHPHILPLFDSGEADGFLYYVMPYVEGETLRDMLNRETQLGIEEAVRIATEVADALAYAHRHNVIHRDIKPENILLHDGRPMVADFGIALAVSAAAGGRMTETGLSIGTPHYMSPEQATAEKDLTNRSDIYSLGAVLYEMLAGDPPHTGSSAQQIIMKIVTDEARPVTELRKSVPPHVAAATAKSLEKLPADRFESAARLAEALTNPAFGLSSGVVTAGTTAVAGGVGAGPRTRLTVPLLVIALTISSIAAIVGWTRTAPTSSAGVISYHLGLPDNEKLVPTAGVSIAVSPDGNRIVYVGRSDDGRQLWIRDKAQLRGAPVPGTEGAWHPFFSPKGESVAFVTEDRQLKVVSLTGGPSLTLVDGGLNRAGGAWGPDDRVYYSAVSGLMSIPATGGGPPRSVTTPDPDGPPVIAHAWPDVLPGGAGVLFSIVRDHLASDVAVVDLATGEQRILVEAELVRYAATGHVVYVREDGSVMAAPFDEERMEISGSTVLLGLQMGRGTTPDIALSSTGRLVYARRPERTLEVVRVERDGNWKVVDPENPMRGIRYAVMSPDGERLAVTTWLRPPGDDGHVWIKQLRNGAFAQLSFEGSVNMRPAWTPDGRSITFISDRGGSRDVWIQRADGTAEAEPLLRHPGDIDEAFFSSGGEWIVHRRGKENGVRDLFAIRVGMDADAVPLVTSNFDEVAPALSPDGQWLAYVSDRRPDMATTRTESVGNVYVRPFPELDSEFQVSANGGIEPVWSRDGGELFFRNGAGDLVAVDAPSRPPFRFGPERVLFSAVAYRSDFFHAAFDVTADGQAFIMIREYDQGNLDEEMIVVENWFEELKAMVGN